MSDALTKLIRSREELLLTPTVRHSAGSLSDLLSEDFIEIGSSGRIYSKPEVISTLMSETPRSLVVTDFQTRLLADDIVLATYRTNDGSGSARESYRSSIWKRSGDDWKILFHQGTQIL